MLILPINQVRILLFTYIFKFFIIFIIKVQDDTRSKDPENIWKGKVLFEAYSKFVHDKDLLPYHLIKEEYLVKAHMYYYILYPVGGFCLGAFVINPIFFSRNTSPLLKKLVISLLTINFGVVGNNRFSKELMKYEQKCFQYYPEAVKFYKKTHDYRFMALMNLKVENYDPVTKIPNF